MKLPAGRFAFYGRVSTEDAQDPSLSIPRQLAACERALEQGSDVSVARYWDIESGRKALAERGRGAEAPAVAVPREGGLNDLLDAARNGRPFDEELADLLEAFDVTAVYDKAGRTLELGATVMPELVPDNEKPRRSRAPSGKSSIAGAGFEPATFGL